MVIKMPRINASQSTRIFQWQNKPEIDLDMIPPVLDAWYIPLLITQGGLRIREIQLYWTNDAKATQNIEWLGLIDGLIVSGAQTLDAGTPYYGYLTFTKGDVLSLIFIKATKTPFSEEGKTDLFTAHSWNLAFRCHSALGVNPEFEMIIHYQTWSEV
jgi:hypothetical protein